MLLYGRHRMRIAPLLGLSVSSLCRLWFPCDVSPFHACDLLLMMIGIYTCTAVGKSLPVCAEERGESFALLGIDVPVRIDLRQCVSTGWFV